jgi:hypothetical protein
LYEQLLQHSPNPTQAIHDISMALNRFPDIRLLQITWGLSSNKDSTLNFVSKFTSEDSQSISSNTETERNNEDTLENYEIVILEAEITNFQGDYRDALSAIEKLQKTLNAFPGAQTKILSLPVNITPTATLNGHVGNDMQMPQARFAIKIVLDHSQS